MYSCPLSRGPPGPQPCLPQALAPFHLRRWPLRVTFPTSSGHAACPPAAAKSSSFTVFYLSPSKANRWGRGWRWSACSIYGSEASRLLVSLQL